MKNCFSLSDNITKSLMETNNYLWANCTKNAWGSWMQGFFSDHLLSNLQQYVADPSSFLVLWSPSIFFFSLVFLCPSFFHFFLLLNTFWQWYLCHFCFLLFSFTWWYFSKNVCNVALSSYWLNFFWFYANESFRDQKNKLVWLPIVF